MAAVDFSRGRGITVKPVPTEITYFLLAKEFNWTPDQVDKQETKKLKGILHILSTYNKIRNQEVARANKKSRR